MKRVILACLLLFFANTVYSQVLLLVGGPDNDVFLGCLNTNKYDSGSIWNKYGTFGSKYSSNSIWNEYGTYGSKYNTYSPWNQYSITPPIIVDADGNFYGYFTINRYMQKRVTIDWILWILDNWQTIIKDTDKAYDMLFR